MKANTKNGSALLIVMCFVVIGGTLVGAILASVMNDARRLGRRERLERALFHADAGVEMAANAISAAEGYGWRATSNLAARTIGDGGFETPVLTPLDFRSFAVTCVGYSGSGGDRVERQVSVDEMFVPTFASFGWWTQINGNIWFIPGDVLYGHTHTDDILKFACWGGNGPLFKGALTSKEVYYTLYSDTSIPHTHASDAIAEGVTFEGGLELDSDQGSMAEVPWSQRSTLADDPAYPHGMYLEGETTIEFQGSQMVISNAWAGLTNATVSIGSESLLYVATQSSTNLGMVNLLGGTVDGKLTIFSEDDMLIHSHIRYANDPRDDHLPEAERVELAPSDDALGLVSKDDIIISQDCPSNLEIFAGMMATGTKSNSGGDPDSPGEFKLQNYSAAGLKGTLTVYGSIVQEQRGPVGTFGSGGISSGFFKDYYWDPRFRKSAPPHYPTLGEKIEYSGWSEHAPLN